MINMDVRKALIERLKNPESAIQGPRIIYLDDSKTWYMDDSQVDAYEALHSSDAYSKGMLESERQLISENMEAMLAELPAGFNFVDLGPGTADKSHMIIRAAIEAGKKVTYTPIDISQKMLGIATRKISALGIPVSPITGDFIEYLPALKEIVRWPKLLYLGSTFMNYEASMISDLLRKGMYMEDKVYVSAQKPYDVNEILRQYSDAGYNAMVKPLIQSLGLREIPQIHVRFKNGAVENYVTMPEAEYISGFGNLKEGDELVLFQSRKPTRLEFQQALSKHFGGRYLENDKYVALLGEPFPRNDAKP